MLKVTQKQITEFKHIAENIIVPNMRLLFMTVAPEKYNEWNGNCCRQAAMLTALYFDKLFPEQSEANMLASVKVYEGKFGGYMIDEKYKGWEHSWVELHLRYLDHELLNKATLMVDISRQAQPLLFQHIGISAFSRVRCIESDRFIRDIFFSNTPFTEIPRKYIAETQCDFYTGLTLKTLYTTIMNMDEPSKEIKDELGQRYGFQTVGPDILQSAGETYRCPEGCCKCCGPVPLLRIEAERLGLDRMYTEGKGEFGDTCEFVSEETGTCTVYENRPFVCRMFNSPYAGVFKCFETAKNGLLTPKEANNALMAYFELAQLEGHVEEFLAAMDASYDLMDQREQRMGWGKKAFRVTGQPG